MNFGSLFSGIGGFDLGFTRSGMKCEWQVEIDANCLDILKRHYPGVTRYRDVRECGKENLKPVDLICGGFPCQDLSVAGKRTGLAGERSGLWFEFHRIIKELRPGWVVVENVPGLLSSHGGKDFAVILRGLVECGYGVSWRVLDAQYFGVAQRRRRVFIVGSLGDGRAAQVLFESEGGAWDTAPSRETRTRASWSASGSPEISGTIYSKYGKTHGTQNDDIDKGAGLLVAHALSASKTATGRLNPNGQDFVIGFSYQSDGRDATEDLAPTLYVGTGLPQMNTSMSVAYTIQQNDGGNHRRKDRPNGRMYVNETDTALTVGGTDQTVIAFDSDRDGQDATLELSPTLKHGGSEPHHHNAYRKMAIAFSAGQSGKSYGIAADENLTPPIRSGESGTNRVPTIAFREQTDTITAAYGTKWNGNASAENGSLYANSPIGVRRLTPVECERLQGFPDGWTAGQADSVRYRQLGNAVAVPVIEWIGRRLMEIERQRWNRF